MLLLERGDTVDLGLVKWNASWSFFIRQQHRVNTVIIEYKDRLARFGVDLLKEFLSSYDTELLIVNTTDSDYKQEIIDNMIAIITHFSSRLYRKRKGRNKANKIKKELLKEEI